MKRDRKILAVAVSLSMVMGVADWPGERQKVQAATYEDFAYEMLTDSTVEITGYQGAETILVIPEKIDEKIVTGIGNRAFQDSQKLMEVRMPDSITTIGSEAFNHCVNLAEINLSGELKNIGDGAFRECSSLTDLQLPSGLSAIGEYAFTATGLTDVTIPDMVTSIERGVFSACTELTEVNLSEGVTRIGTEAFIQCMNLAEISIPDSVTSIGHSAFQNCTGLTDVSISEGLVSIEEAAFDGCSSLTNIYYAGTEEQWDRIQIGLKNEPLIYADIFCDTDITDGSEEDYEYQVLDDDTIEITRYKGNDAELVVPGVIGGRIVSSIGMHAFSDCKGMKKITLSSGIEKIDIRAFFMCQDLVEMHLPDGLSDIGRGAFAECTSLVSLDLPASITSIGTDAFKNCTALETIDIPSGVTTIASEMFYNCTALKKINLADSITSIEERAFSGCKGLMEINLPDGVTSIEAYVFYDCTNLTEAEIPDSVTSIGEFAFHGCTSLTTIKIPVRVADIRENGFDKCSSLRDIYYSGTKEQWNKINIHQEGNAELLLATIHCIEDPSEPAPDETDPPKPAPDETDPPKPAPDETVPPETVDARQELERLTSGDPFALAQDFQHYLSEEQINSVETCLYTWLADINYAYKYSENSGIKERIMKKAGIDPQGDFANGTEQAVTHISVETVYGPKTFEITLNLGQPDSSGDLYPAYGAMQYAILEKGNIPSDLPINGQIGRNSYADLGPFAACVGKASEDSLYHTYQWQSLDHEMAAGVLIDKTATEIIGNKNGSFSDGVFTIYAKPLFTYSKKVTISCPVDVYVYDMNGTEAGAIINNQPHGGNQNVHLDVNGDTKTVYLAGNDYYLNLKGTDTGTMKYEVEEIANEEVRRNVQFLELQLKKDMQYEGYVFRPLNIDRDLYALRTIKGSEKEVIYADTDSYQSAFKRVQELSLSQKSTWLDADHKVQLNASLYPLDASNPDLKWTTDNDAIASVDSNGLVTAVSAGRATVSVSTKDGSFLKQFCVIDVAEKKGSGSEENGDGTDAGTNRPGDHPNGSGSGTGGFGSSSGGSTGGGFGSSAPSVEQEKTPVIAKLHYVLQFNANGGMNLSRRTMTLLAEDAPGIMPKVQRKDYIFDGWYTKQEGGTRIAGDTPLTEAATLYARWTKAQAPAKVAAPTLKSKKKGQMQISFQQVKDAAGYEIMYAGSSKFTSAKTKSVGASVKTKTIIGLKAGKKYYVRVRAYTQDSMRNKIYGAYSAANKVQIQD